MESWSDETRRAVGENYAYMLGKIMSEAEIDGFWFESSTSDAQAVSWIDINWKDADGNSRHSDIWEERD